MSCMDLRLRFRRGQVRRVMLEMSVGGQAGNDERRVVSDGIVVAARRGLDEFENAKS